MDVRPNWDTYYYSIAMAVSARATCLRRKYGAIIVKNHNIISSGYCGSPKDTPNCCDVGVCERKRLGVPAGERYELCVSVHAEQNAIMRATYSDMQGATIYIAGVEVDTGQIADSHPCMMCDRAITNAGITRVVCWDSQQYKLITIERGKHEDKKI